MFRRILFYCYLCHIMIKAISNIGQYFLLLGKVFTIPDRFNIFYRQTMREIQKLGIDSLPIVSIVSLFVGAVITIQTNYNIENPFLPRYLVGVTVRDSLLLEFSSTMMAMMLAGKVGSSISSEIGMMRVTEQIDALEVMGVNSANYLILPKLVATIFFFPILCLLSIFIGLVGGYTICILTQVIPPADYIYGIQYIFYPHYVTYAITKMIVFAFLITSVSAYFGYFVEGGALDVGKSSTKAVVQSFIMILISDLVITKTMLQ